MRLTPLMLLAALSAPAAAHAQDRPGPIDIGDLRVAMDVGKARQLGRLGEQRGGDQQGGHETDTVTDSLRLLSESAV